MTVPFPSLCPLKRDYAPGEYATRRFNSVSGAGVTRLYGSKPFDASLSLEFNVDDNDLQDVLTCYEKALGQYGIVLLPDELFVGMDLAIREDIQGSLNWRWAERPTVSSLRPNYSKVKTQFIATLDAQ